MTYRKDWAQPQGGPEGFANTMKTFGRVVNLAATDMVTGGTVGAFKVPAGFTVTGIIAVASDMDAVTTLTISVGDAASGTRYLSAATIGQTGATTQTLATTGLLFLNVVDTEIIVTCTLQTATPLAGTLALYLSGFISQ
jgi:hypothetical protein